VFNQSQPQLENVRELLVYSPVGQPDEALHAWLMPNQVHRCRSLHELQIRLLQTPSTCLVLDLRHSPQRMLAELRYLQQHGFKNPVLTLIQDGQLHYGRESLRLGAAAYTDPACSNGLALNMLLDSLEQMLLMQQPKVEGDEDVTTGAASRSRFFDRLTHALQRGKRKRSYTGVVLLDVDRFREINQHYGEHVGDQVLRASVERIQALLRKSDTIARLSSNEFGLVLEDITDPLQVSNICRKINQLFERPLLVNEEWVVVTLGIGVHVAAPDEQSTNTLVRFASLALSRAKEVGRNTLRYYSHEMNLKAIARTNMEVGLFNAMQRHELFLQYQPICQSGDFRPCSAEALVRWQHPTAGVVSPAVFVPLLEDSGLIVEAGDWILETACATLHQWHNNLHFPTDFKLSVNVSGKQLKDLDYIERVKRVMALHHIQPGQLTLELTESTVMENMDKTVQLLEKLRGIGVAISLDDFGTGYSSFAYLKRLPVDYLKIDRSFVTNMASDKKDAAIAQAIVELAHLLGMKVVAEGVDSSDKIELLRAMQCDHLQGFYFAKPMDAGEFGRYVQKHPAV
jgi:diguanylate cyclase (GGDEF)-like protein